MRGVSGFFLPISHKHGENYSVKSAFKSLKESYHDNVNVQPFCTWKRSRNSINTCCCLFAKLCPTFLWPPWTIAHTIVLGNSQARRLELVAISFCRGSSWLRDWTHISCIGRWIIYRHARREALTGALGTKTILNFEGKNKHYNSSKSVLDIIKCNPIIKCFITTTEQSLLPHT